jgi:hypothetical protein
MKRAPQCEVLLRKAEWPYIIKCQGQAEYEVVNSEWQKRLGVRLICDLHRATLLEDFDDTDIELKEL